MNGAGGSPLALGIPVSSASPSGSNNTTTGRPPLWNPSSQRKVSRLYLYTTLSLQKIIDVVHAKSPESAPGKDSANKKLNTLLDKEPRWLHPRTDSDMGRRLNELSLSPTRTTARPHAFSDPPPMLNPNADFKRDLGNNSLTLEVPTFHAFGTNNRSSFPASNQYVQPVPPTARRSQVVADQQETGNALEDFLRRSTIMSSSTDCTNGTLNRVLQGYPDKYVKTVRRLIKRYTAPNGADSISPISEIMTPNNSWMADGDTPPSLPMRPYHLPGDFLSLDLHLQQQGHCFSEQEQHLNRSCFCFAESEIQNSPWVTSKGLTAEGQDILWNGINNANLGDRDPFENTVLHFIAARAALDRLVHAISSGRCDPLLNARNTAGQTFLHLLDPSSLRDQASIYQLLSLLHHKGFDIYTRDVYGRNFFHMMLLTEGAPLNGLLENYDQSRYMKRDAFNVTPSLNPEPTAGINRAYTQAMDLDPPPAPSPFTFFSEADRDAAISHEAFLIKFVRSAEQFPSQEDSEGRNGLHCLAAATLSNSSILKKYGMANPQMQANQRGKKNQEPKDLDSCTDKLSLRLSAVNRLLLARVNPNHYDNAGNTPLMAFAAQLPEEDDYKFGPKILESLIDNGAEVNARNRHGETALHIAVRCGRKLAARTLVQRGANVHVRDAAGRSLLEVADIKTRNAHGAIPKEYVHFEACRAWLSGKGYAVQEPTVMQEWAFLQGPS
ncbi:Fc.00g008320.m01.CDS01 [Cosmosporella sp. VM-42]